MSTRLDSLPPEILFTILAFCEPNCNLTATSYPLCILAATNKHLHDIVEEYARGLLKQHVQDTKAKLPKSHTNRRKWLAEMCQYCKNNCKRKAILYPTIACCRGCDRARFPKMTMTNAIKNHNLSKLDLFTPNVLHPDLPRLAVGSYDVYGSTCTMLSESDVLARRDLIYARLGAKAKDHSYMSKRSNVHDRIVLHSCMRLKTSDCSWVKFNLLSAPIAPKSMRTSERRKEYARKALEKEWADMGVTSNGASRDTAIELD